MYLDPNKIPFKIHLNKLNL